MRGSRGSAGLPAARCLGLGALVALALTGCQSPRVVLRTGDVVRAVEVSIAQQRHVRARVSCPRTVARKKGTRFRCYATVRGERHRVDVREVDDRGHVAYVVR